MTKYSPRNFEKTKKVTITMTESEIEVGKALSLLLLKSVNLSRLFRTMIKVSAKKYGNELIDTTDEENF